MKCKLCHRSLLLHEKIRAGACAPCRAAGRTEPLPAPPERKRRQRQTPSDDVMVLWKPGITLEEMVKNVSLACLDAFDGNRTRTAASLGVSIKSLRNWLTAWKVPPWSEYN